MCQLLMRKRKHLTALGQEAGAENLNSISLHGSCGLRALPAIAVRLNSSRTSDLTELHAQAGDLLIDQSNLCALICEGRCCLLEVGLGLVQCVQRICDALCEPRFIGCLPSGKAADVDPDLVRKAQHEGWRHINESFAISEESNDLLECRKHFLGVVNELRLQLFLLLEDMAWPQHDHVRSHDDPDVDALRVHSAGRGRHRGCEYIDRLIHQSTKAMQVDQLHHVAHLHDMHVFAKGSNKLVEAGENKRVRNAYNLNYPIH